MIDTPEIADDLEEPVGPPERESAGEWRKDRNGNEYVPRREGRGRVMRQGQESVEEAHARDAGPRPTARPKRPKKKLPDPPKKIELKLLEEELANALKAPGAVCMAIGEEWPAEHFIENAKPLARNLVLAADHNPWLLRQLEEIATGQQAMGKIISLFAVSGALFMYAVPPAIYFLNLSVPDSARAMLGRNGQPIPHRKPRPDVFPPPQAAPPPAQPVAA